MTSDLVIRPAHRLDATPMADLLNDIITLGGTTTRTAPLSAADLWQQIGTLPRSACHVAESDGRSCGFQHITPWSGLPPEACDIATFVKTGCRQLGVGSALFDATAEAARDLGYGWICAAIRADNKGGLAYYQSRGFRPYGLVEDLKLASGQVVNQVLTRFDLD